MDTNYFPVDAVKPQEQGWLCSCKWIIWLERKTFYFSSVELNPQHTVHLPPSLQHSIVRIRHTYFLVLPFSTAVSHPVDSKVSKSLNTETPIKASHRWIQRSWPSDLAPVFKHVLLEYDAKVWQELLYKKTRSSAAWSDQALLHSEDQKRFIYKMKSQRPGPFLVLVVLH